jgi:hypothetical protein
VTRAGAVERHQLVVWYWAGGLNPCQTNFHHLQLTPNSASRPIYLLDAIVAVGFHPRPTGPYLTRIVDCYKKYMALADEDANWHRFIIRHSKEKRPFLKS